MYRPTLRTILLATGATCLLAACSGGGGSASVGTTGPVTVNTGGGTGGTGGGVDFVGSAGCPAGLPEVTVT